MKLERARRHIAELAHEIEVFTAQKPYTVVVEEDAKAAQRLWKLKVAERVPQWWSTIVGDAIHNTRASLDLLMCAVVRCCDPGRQSIKHVHFIVRDTKEKFEADLPKNIKGASPAAIQRILDLKPYKGGNDALWRLHQLDILDKHQGIVPVGSAYRSVDIMPLLAATMRQLATDNEMTPDLLELGPLKIRPADRLFPLQDGAELFRAPLDHPLPVGNGMKFTFEISFGEGQIIDGEPVIPALSQLTEHVDTIFDAFEVDILK